MHRIATRIFNSSALRWSDVVLLAMSLALGTIWDYQPALADDLHHYFDIRISVRNLVLLGAALLIWRFCLWAVGLYRSTSTTDLVFRVLGGVLLSTPLAAFALHLRHTGGTLLGPTIVFMIAAFVFLVVSRGFVSLSATIFHAHARPRRVALIVGSGNLAQQLALDLRQSTAYDYDIYGFVDSEELEGSEAIGPRLGDVESLSTILMHTPVDDVMIGLPIKSHYSTIQRVTEIVEIAGVQTQFPTKIVMTSVVKSIREDNGRMILTMTHHDGRRHIKRLFDVVIASVLLVLLLPLFLVVAILIPLSDWGPVFFKQQRYGLNKRRFYMYKFRSMVVDAEKKQAAIEHLNENAGPVFKIKSDPRITWIGKIIRKTSIDELPQLVNVLRGEMSLVGPRPLPLRDVTRFQELRHMRRFSVLPGMTGLWQVSGRSNLNFDGWVDLDLRYIDHWTLLMDVKILAMTLPAVLRGSGAA
ncbi:sugar transferase [Terriglobus roseus]|uniref:Exopolysaccharide biosynthesis polyprenyl glycosylphosphotransferase n=1 Tax=Terriglobus roseus TaxID=392734 RepID=A0A1H4TSM0_9BACT|nr:sugar transferase [Terriglobus roseus]SEC59516.1 exopolysaccharide biosynthesis polyprenyl glycosylphosphotransferase [Terriglobus roseus]